MAMIFSPLQSARTPTGIFAVLGLSPGSKKRAEEQDHHTEARQAHSIESAMPTPVPSFHFSPPTGSSSDSPFYATSFSLSPSSPTFSPASSVPGTGGNEHSSEVKEGMAGRDGEEKHRTLAPNEAKQLTLLLTQNLFPVRNAPKALMSACIELAERLHQVGIRWDTKRRVMGMHLRGIWEEGQRFPNHRIGGFGPMELYVQGSFLSITETPHPLDPMPIPIEVHLTSFATLPKITLRAGLASSVPAGQRLLENAIVAQPVYSLSDTFVPETPLTPFSPESDIMGLEDIPLRAVSSNTGIHGGLSRSTQIGHLAVGSDMVLPLPMKTDNAPEKKRRLREKKKAGLKIHTKGTKATNPSLHTPRSALSKTKSTFKLAKLFFFPNIIPFRRRRYAHRIQPQSARPAEWHRFGLPIGKSAQPITPGGTKSARKISFGGWEVR